MAYHAEPANKALEELKTSEKGLKSEEAEKRLEEYGRNKIEREHKISPLQILMGQFTSPLVWLLLVAMVVSWIIEEHASVYAIGAIVILNAILGFVQEYKAERAIEKLQKLVALKVKVRRDGKEQEIPAEELVPGDIMLLETGDKVGADARIISQSHLNTQEAPLTGESTPVGKQAEPVKEGTGVADRKCMVFSGTTVTKGHAEAVVTATGKKTQIGQIASMIEKTKTEPTPLQKKLKVLGIWLAILVVVLAIVMFTVGIASGENLTTMLMTAIALAVAAIPEGLPAVVTTCLALGVQRMANRNALVRKLPSVETLGACTVICTDKTGTLTHNQMTVKRVYANNQDTEVTGSGYTPEGKFSEDPENFEKLLLIGALNNNAKITKEKGKLRCIGDPTEGALLVSAKKAGMDWRKLQEKYPRVDEIEFTSERKRMTTIHKMDGKQAAFTKGAPEVVLDICSKILINGEVKKLTKQQKDKILEQNEEYASKALRILGFAYKEDTNGEIEQDMIFAGLQAMIDPPREECKQAIEKCKQAGIRVIMITGDHASTAKAVGKELGLTGKVLTGEDLAKTDLNKAINEVNIFARVDPKHKVDILKALKDKGHIVAMTGDGVNDAPALKKADIGIAMGITGTDVSKEASEMILADDNFSTIVNAVEEGRIIFDNIIKFVEYLLSSNLGELLTLFMAIIARFPLPLLPLHILWINLVTDGLPALALGVEPGEPRVMKREPRDPEEHIVNKHRTLVIFLVGIVMAVGTLIAFKLKPESQINYAQTMAFTTLVMFQMFNVLNQRSMKLSIFQLKQNWWLWGAMAVSILMQVLVVHWGVLQSLFNTIDLRIMDWAICIAIAASVLGAVEIAKAIYRATQE